MKRILWPVYSALALVLLGACAGMDDEEVAAPLPVFNAQFEPKPSWDINVDSYWSEDVVHGLSDLYHWVWPWAGLQDRSERPADIDVPSLLTPLWYNNSLYVVNNEGLLLRLNQAGEVTLRKWLATPVSAGITAAAGRLYLGTPEGEVLALNADTGEEVWRNVVSSEIIAAPSVADGVVVVRCVDGKLFALNAESGERQWFADRNVPALTQRGTSAPAIVGGMVIAGFDNGKVSAFRQADGKELWEKRLAQPTGRSEIDRLSDVDADPLVFGSSMYAASFNGSVMAVDLRNGETTWQREMSTYRSMGVDAQMLFVASAQGHVSALDRRNGFVVWTQKGLENRHLTAPVAFDQFIVVGDSEGYLHFLNREDGHFVAGVDFDRDGFQTAPQIVDGKLLVYGQSGRLQLYDGTQGVGMRATVDCQHKARYFRCPAKLEDGRPYR